jgi:hypothetical protein
MESEPNSPVLGNSLSSANHTYGIGMPSSNTRATPYSGLTSVAQYWLKQLNPTCSLRQ